MKKSTIILLVVIAVIVLLVFGGIGTYNGLVSKKENVDTSSANLDVMLQRRADLIPNLVNTVKGYAKQENDVIDKVTTARQNLVNSNNLQDKVQANNELTSALNGLMLVVENYPDLKSSQNFIQLSDQLEGSENRISTARKDYNEAVKTYNAATKTFPSNIFAGMFNFEEATYFEATEGSQEVPNVSFE